MAITRTILICSSVVLSVAMLGRPSPPIDTLSVVGVAIDADGKRLAGREVKLVAAATGAGELARDRTSDTGVFNLYVTNIGGQIPDLYVIYPQRDFDVQPLAVRVSQAGDRAWIDLRPGDLVFKGLPVTAELTTEQAADQLASTLKTQTIMFNAGLIDQKTYDANVAARGALIREKIRDRSLLVETNPALTSATTERVKDFKLAIDPAKISIMSGRAATVGRGAAAGQAGGGS